MHYVYGQKELFQDIPRADFEAESGNIIIYGAGFQGLLAAFLLKKRNIRVVCFVDQNPEKRKGLYFGLPVISPEEMYEKYSKALIIVTPYVFEPLYREFKSKGLNVVTPFSLFLEFDSEGFDELAEIPDWYRPETLDFNVDMFLRRCNNLLGHQFLGAIELSVSQKCTLRCKECTSLMPYYDHPRDFNLEDLIEYCDKVLKNRRFNHMYVEGGEPFIWKDMPKLLRYLGKRDELLNVILITNGTVIPSGELLEELKNPKMMVRISDYGSRTKKDTLINLFKENGIRYKVQIQKWAKMTDFRLRTEEEYMDNISSCCKLGEDGSPHISDGRLFVCPIQANLHNTGIFVSPEEDYVDLHKSDCEEIQIKIDSFLRAQQIPHVCRYCNGRGYTGIIVPPAEQLAPGEKMQVVFERGTEVK